MDTISLWEAITAEKSTYPKLTKEIEVDVAIVGAGITGITTALHLIDTGKTVAILESDTVGSGTTGFSTGNLYVAVQPYYQNILKKFNLDITKQIAQSRKLAIDYIEQNVRTKNISCNFSRRPWYIFTDDEKQFSFLEKEVEVLKQCDIDIDFILDLPLPLKFKKAALMPNQARFNPLQYVKVLASDLAKRGCHIYEKTRVLDVEENEMCEITTTHGRVIAKNAVLATHTPTGVNSVQFYTAAYRSYVVSVHVADHVYPEGHFWDLNQPHHALCTHSDSRNNEPNLLLVAGSHHKTGQDKDAISHFHELEQFLRHHFSVTDVPYQWSAQHYHAADDVPYIGLASRFAKNTYYATGFFADGLIYGTIAGMILADCIAKKDNALLPVYQSNRFTPVASAPFLIKEGSNILFEYLKDFPKQNTKNFQWIKPGHGEVVEINNEKCGVYRDEENKLHAVCAVCTHMKCILSFNNAEKTWDCPCHGSRFKTDGTVIEGPAQNKLAKIDITEQ